MLPYGKPSYILYALLTFSIMNIISTPKQIIDTITDYTENTSFADGITARLNHIKNRLEMVEEAIDQFRLEARWLYYDVRDFIIGQ